jgi:sugar transferase (PEP-CTERM/EpsH1 system associated)
MRLLFLTPQLPYPPQQGTALRNWGLISHLSQNHEVWLLSFAEASAVAGGATIHPVLKRACKSIETVRVPTRSQFTRARTLVTSTLPDMAWRLWSPEFERQLRAWLRDHHFDIVQVEGIELARYMCALTADHRPRDYRLVFDDHNCEYLLQQRTHEADLKRGRLHGALYSWFQWRRLYVFERTALQTADATLCVSPQDRALLQTLAPRATVRTIYNGIDVARYAASTPSISSPPRAGGTEGGAIVFTGKMDFRPNIEAMLWFQREVWPAVKRAHPAAKWYIVGQKPSPRLEPLRNDPDIVITGQVDDVQPYIAQADVYIAPLQAGGGTRFKLLEAMAMRRAIVSTTLGCEGFNVTSGREMIVADSGSEFAGAIIELLRSEPRRREMGARAHAFVAATYDWASIVPKLEDVYRQLVSQ